MADNSPLVKDWFMLGFLGGAAASVVKSAVNALMEKAGIATTYYGSMSSGVILGKKFRLRGLVSNRPRSFGEWGIGYVADTIAGGILGSALAYVYHKTPPGNETWKGAIGGATVWAGVLTAGRHLRIAGFEKATPAKMASLLATSVLYGGLHGWLTGKYGASLIDQSHPMLVKEVSNQEFNRGRFARDFMMRRPRQFSRPEKQTSE